MKVSFITDIHGKTLNPKQFQDTDVLLIGGDITQFGGYEEAKGVLNNILHLKIKIFALRGNCDYEGVETFLVEKGIYGEGVHKVGNITFLGMGGANKTPFNTPFERNEEEIERFLNGYKIPQPFILFTHVPSYKTKLDRVGFMHTGSRAIRSFIEGKAPLIAFSGHIHQAQGKDYLGNTILINPGPYPNIARIELKNKKPFSIEIYNEAY